MATALELNAASTLINGQGLAANSSLTTQFATFVAHTPIVQLANIFTFVQTDANAAANLLPILTTIGNATTNNTQWLLDLTPTNTYYYITNKPSVFGNTSSPTKYRIRLSTTITNQASGPFTGGLTTFANVYATVSSYLSSNFDKIASAGLLSNKTYADSGIGFTGPGDVATGGLGNSGPLLGETVKNWGTMYDIKHMTKITDPYVFGQNLLSQRLGTYGNLTNQLSNVGLNTSDLTNIPKSGTTTTQESGTVTQQTVIGEIEIPGLVSVTTTTVVPGSSPTVVKNIYANVTQGDLASIVSATGFSGNTTQLLTLNDYLDYQKVIPANVRANLSSRLGINSFEALSQTLHDKVGQGNFKTWKELSDFLLTLEVPALNHTTTNASTPLINNLGAITTGLTGSGPFNNLILSDMLGCAAGDRYTVNANVLNFYYNTIVSSSTVSSAMANLVACINGYMANVDAGDTATVQSNVTALNTALNAVPTSANLTYCKNAYANLWANVQTEISSLQAAGVDYSGTTTDLRSFAQSWSSTASDKDKNYTYQFFTNLITNDSAGDTLRAAIAENINTRLLRSKGINLTNDANPSGIISEAQRQGKNVTADYVNQYKNQNL